MPNSRSLTAALALAALFSLPALQPAQAKLRQESQPEAGSEAATPVMKPRTARIFGRVRDGLQAQQYAEAKRELERLHVEKLNRYERAQRLRLHGTIAYGQENNAAAIDYLNQSLAEQGLPSADQADTLFQVAQIQAVEKRWQDVIATLESWFRTVERPNSVGYFLMALSQFQLGNVDAALLPAKKAVEIAKQPQQTWLQLLLALHLTKKDYASAAPVVEQMIALYPNSGKDTWLQLSALYGATDDPARALGVLELAHRRGLLTEDRDLRRLLQLMLARGIPNRAAEIFERELAAKRIQEDSESLELLSASWILAREIPKADAPLARAAELAADGDLWVRAGQIHMLQEEWAEAASSLRKALDKGGLENAGNVQLLLGIAYYNAQKLQEARNCFAIAQRSDKTREQAQTWIEHIDRELGAGRETASWGG